VFVGRILGLEPASVTVLAGRPEPAGGGVTFLFHNLIQLHYIELVSTTGRA